MKQVIIVWLCVGITLAGNGQKLKRPKKDKKTGLTITATESMMLNSTSVKLLGAHSKMLMASVFKTDTGGTFLNLIGETDGYRYEIHEGDSVKISLEDGTVIWLPGTEYTRSNPSRHPDGRAVSYWDNNFWLDEATQQKLKNSDVVNIGASANDKSLNFSYTVDPKKKGLIKKMLLLFDKGR